VVHGSGGAIGVVVAAFVAVESVPGRPEVEASLRMMLAVQRHVLGRDQWIVLTKVEQHRRLQSLVQEGHTAAAVVAHCRQTQTRVGEERNRATPAESDHGHLALVLQGLGHFAHVVHRALQTQVCRQLAPARDAVVVVAEFDVMLDVIEQGRGHGHETVCGKTLDDAPDVRIHPEDFLHHDQRALGRDGRVGAPAADAAGIPKVGPGIFVSLGCPKALVDSERILTQLRSRATTSCRAYDDADVVVVNTCGFIDAAVEESLDAIGEALAENGKVIVTGCLGKRAEVIREKHPGVLSISGPQDYAA
jgi:hypothetical protein